MASGDAASLGPIAETQATSMQPSELQEMQAMPSEATAKAARSHSEKEQVAPKTSDLVEKVASIHSASTEDSLRKKMSVPCTTFHIPALEGRPNGGKHTLRTRPVLISCDPQVRKRFTLTIYAMLSVQVAVVASLTALVAAGIGTGTWLPNEIAPTTPTTPESMPGYPFNVLIHLSPAWLCVVLSSVALSLFRYNQITRRYLFAACTFITGIFLGLLTYVESCFPTSFICVVLLSLVIHTVSISVNLISYLASALGQVKPKASKMEMMGQESRLSGPEKLICLLNDEEAAYTRASLMCAGMSWIAATVTSALVVAIFDLAWLPWFFSAATAGPFVVYFMYGVEKQVRRCNPEEKESAMLNLSIDLFFFVAEGLTVDTSILKSPELGSARPRPVVKGSQRYTMKQVSSKTSRATTMSSTPSKPWKPVETVGPTVSQVAAPMDTVAV